MRSRFSFRPVATLALATAGLAACGVTALYLLRMRWNVLLVGSMFEIAAVFAVLMLLVNFRPAQRAMDGLPLRMRVLLLLLALISVLAQEVKMRHLTYPFVDWRMYSDSDHGPLLRFQHYDGVRADGTRVPLSLGREVRSLDEWRLYTRLEAMARIMFTGSGPDGLDPDRHISEALRAVGRIHNDRHPEDPIVAIELLNVMLDTRTHRADDELDRRLRKRIELDAP
ncbi:MAG: hypothetical protein GY716_07435 [bacterium]|nr:hypothetical protein [bacterium]